MQIKEIDGKKYIEFDEEKDRKKKMIISVLFLVLIAGAIIGLIVATITLIKNKDLILEDPIVYGMDLHEFVSCQCLDTSGNMQFVSEVSDGPG